MSTTCHFYPIWSRLDKVWFLETGGSESPMPELERSLGTHWISEVNLCLNAAKEFAPHNGAKWTLTENQRWGVLTPRLRESQMKYEQIYHFCGPLFCHLYKRRWIYHHSPGYHMCFMLVYIAHSNIFTRRSLLAWNICDNALRYLFGKLWGASSLFES